MAISRLKEKTVKEIIDICKLFVHRIKPRLDALNIDYDAQGGVKETLTQQEMDELVLSGLTKAELDDAAWFLTAVVRPELVSSFSQIEKAASRAENTNLPFNQ